jgi:hypothetical protein
MAEKLRYMATTLNKRIIQVTVEIVARIFAFSIDVHLLVFYFCLRLVSSLIFR